MDKEIVFMTDDRPTEGTVAEELRQLGRNLTEVLRAAWDSPERKAFQAEVANGIKQLGEVLREETQKFSESPTGQRVKEKTGDVREKIRSRDDQARLELINALKAANTRLRQTAERMSAGSQGSGIPNTGTETGAGRGSEGSQAGAPRQVWMADPHTEGRHEVHPDDIDPPPKETGHQEIHPDDLE
jgi:hypothetical protein